MQQLKERPAFVTFETRPVEDRQASIEAGAYVGRDVDFAIITPAGSKDRIERVVIDWFDKLREDQAAERIPADWVKYYRSLYEDFKAGKATPVNGFPVRDWPGISPAQLKTLQSLHLLAVEDVAAANEETIARMGMGGRSLKDRAIKFLETANNIGKVAERSAALEQENLQMKSDIAQLTETMRIMQAQLAAGTATNTAIGVVPQEGISSADFLDDAQKL